MHAFARFVPKQGVHGADCGFISPRKFRPHSVVSTLTRHECTSTTAAFWVLVRVTAVYIGCVAE